MNSKKKHTEEFSKLNVLLGFSNLLKASLNVAMSLLNIKYFGHIGLKTVNVIN